MKKRTIPLKTATAYFCVVSRSRRTVSPTIADDYDDIRWHGKDERISAAALYEGREFMYRLVKALSSPTR